MAKQKKQALRVVGTSMHINSYVRREDVVHQISAGLLRLVTDGAGFNVEIRETTDLDQPERRERVYYLSPRMVSRKEAREMYHRYKQPIQGF